MDPSIFLKLEILDYQDTAIYFSTISNICFLKGNAFARKALFDSSFTKKSLKFYVLGMYYSIILHIFFYIANLQTIKILSQSKTTSSTTLFTAIFFARTNLISLLMTYQKSLIFIDLFNKA